jgi:predicted nuclease of predicted toxin-antitoxin system
MQFLADECCDALIVRTLRALQHDVAYIAEESPGIADQDILKRSLEQERILITEDRDFCELVFRDNQPAYGIVLVRIPVQNRLEKAHRITILVDTHGQNLEGSITTLTVQNMKLRKLP